MSALITLFHAQVARAPDHPAIAGVLSYAALDRWSDLLAGGLVQAGLIPGQAVALRMARSPRLVAMVLAVLKAGGVVFPLGVKLPPARVAVLLAEAQAAWVISDAELPPLPQGDWQALNDPAEVETRLPLPDASRPGFIFHTSGTTGRPKAMRIGQRGLLRVAHAPDYVTFNTGARVAFLSNPAFDAFSFEIWGALLNGGTLVPFGDDEILDLDGFAQKLTAQRVTTAFLTTSLFNVMATEHPQTLLGLQDVVFGGEAASPAVLHRLLASHPDTACRLTNGYGPTETTTFAATHRIDPKLWSRTDHPNSVPIGTALAETTLWIADGDQLAAEGAWGEILICGSGLAEGYLGRPEETAAKFVTFQGRRAYRSGDLGRWQGGVLEYGGRLDQQVKLRGHRIEPAEIEAHLARQPQVQHAAVMVIDGQLVGFITGTATETALRAALAADLPAYMVPSHLIPLARMPLTPNGKLDRAALAALISQQGADTRSFLQQGGDSLQAAQLSMRLRREGKAVSVADLLSPRPLADVLAAANRVPATVPPIIEAQSHYPAAAEQRRLWLIQQMQPGSTAYSIPLRFDFAQVPDRAALLHGLAAIVQRHAALRGAFSEKDAELWVETRPAYAPELPEITDEDGFFAQPFDLAAGRLLHAATIGRRLLLNLHHIAVDGWSLNLILADLAAALRGQPMASASDYSAYPALQAAAFADPAYADRRKARQQHLLKKTWQGDEALYLPNPGSGRIRGFTLPARLQDAVQALALARDETVFSILLSAFALSLWRLNGAARVSVGVPVGLRPEGFDETVGMFVNTQVCRFDAAPEGSLADWLAQAGAEAAALHAQYDVAFDHILADQRAAAQRGNLFDAMFVLENTNYNLPGVEAHFQHPLQVDPRFPLTLFATLTPHGLSCQIEHDLTRYGHDCAARLEGLFGDTLARITAGFDHLADLLPPADPLARIAEHAARHPAQIAVQAPDGSLTYAELMARASGIAAMLQREGIAMGDRIGISLRPSVAMAAAVLGVMQARAVWVPLDPDYPAARLAYLVEDSGLRLVLGDGHAILPASVRVVPPKGSGTADLPAADPDHMAYVIYTSGSTGQPKGVCVSHRGLANYINCVVADYFGQASLTAGVVSTSLNFDATITSLLGPLASGRRVDILPLGDMAGLTERALLPEPLLLKLTPSHLVAMLAYANGRQGEAAHLLVVGGEQLPAALVRKVLAMLPEARLVNEYGPTETVVGCATAWADRAGVPEWGGTMLIGQALRGMDMSIRRADGSPAPVGEQGELLIQGVSVAPGYLNRPQLTAERFITLSDGQRGYLSGDLALQLPSGDFACLGRMDDQIKLNGYRIEPGEIEAVLLSDPRVTGAAVVVQDGQLRAFVVSTAPPAQLRPALAAKLARDLPAHLRPSQIAQVDSLPLTSNGKTDRAALIARVPQAAPTSPHPQANTIAASLHSAFADILGQPLDPDLHFFDAGAGSLALMQVHARLKGIVPHVTLLDFFDHPTLNALAGYLGNNGLPQAGHPTQIATQPLSNALQDAFAEILGQPLDPDLHFFDAGAGSLVLMQVHARIKALAPDLKLLDFFEYPTLNSLGSHLSNHALSAPAPVTAIAAQPDARRIAIIGMAADLPGASDLASLWDMIASGREAIVHGPSNGPGHVNAVSAMADPAAFDPEHFGISLRDAQLMDPQQRQLLMGAVKALDHAGIDPARLPQIGLVLGSSENSYHHALLKHGGDAVSGYGLSLIHEKDFLATRIAHLLNLHGPALTVQTACSTSLVAVHQACQMLRAGTAQVAIAGGAGIDLGTLNGYQHQAGHIFSADGHCAPFSAEASGTVPANGWGLVVLRPLDAALAAGDRVLAVIEGIAINNDGAAKVGFTAPSLEGQMQVITAAMAEAGATAATLGYVEAHGTATALGDPIEVEALSRALGPAAAASVALGSVKSQIGHMGAGAGVAGLIRTVLALWHQTVPPSLGFHAPSPAIDFAQSPLRVQSHSAAWPQDRPFAGISSFGMGGTNAHAVLSPPPKMQGNKAGPQALLFSARSETALRLRVARVAARLLAGSDLSAMAAALQRAARNHPWRAAVVAETSAEAAVRLERMVPVQAALSSVPLPSTPQALVSAWVSGLDATVLPRPMAQAAWDLPPYPFDTKLCLHPAALGPISRRLPYAEWFRVPVWQRAKPCHAAALPTLAPEISPAQVIAGHEMVLRLNPGDGAAPLLALLSQHGLAMNRLGVRLTLRTSGAFGPEGVQNPDIAMLAGLLRVVAAELPALHPRLIDAPEATRLPRSDHQGFAQFALRGGRLWQEADAAITPAQPAMLVPGLYLISGGTGGIGRALAGRLAAVPGCRVILAARHLPKDPLPKGMTAHALDVADTAAVARLAAELAARGERLQGIIHAAGAPGGAASVLLNAAQLADTLRPKRDGAQALMQHLAPLTDGFVLFCSSLSARQGIAGQADYAAANAWLDAYAEAQTMSVPQVLSINWPAWRGIGMNAAVRAGGGRMADLAETLDAGAISADEAWQVFLTALALGQPQLCVNPLPPAAITRPQSILPPEATSLAQIFARHLGLESVSAADSFYDLGGDSLQALEVIDEAARRGLGVLPASLLAGRFTLAEVEAALTTAPAPGSVITLRAGVGVPIVLIHPIGGDTASYRDLVPRIATGRPILAIEDPVLSNATLTARSIPEMAQDYLTRFQGPIELLGWSFGGMVAQAMAAAAPDRITQLALIDPPLPEADRMETAEGFLAEITHRKTLGTLPETAAEDHPYLAALLRAWRRNSAAMRLWQPQPVAIKATVWLALEQGACDERQAAWSVLLPAASFHRLPADHFSILRPPFVDAIAASLTPLQQSAAE